MLKVEERQDEDGDCGSHDGRVAHRLFCEGKWTYIIFSSGFRRGAYDSKFMNVTLYQMTGRRRGIEQAFQNSGCPGPGNWLGSPLDWVDMLGEYAAE